MKNILKWMQNNKERFRDPLTNEINHTLMVEAWDSEQSTGDATMDPDHPAWDIATKV